MPYNKVSIKVVVEGDNAAQSVGKLSDAFERVKAEVRRIADSVDGVSKRTANQAEKAAKRVAARLKGVESAAKEAGGAAAKVTEKPNRDAPEVGRKLKDAFRQAEDAAKRAAQAASGITDKDVFARSAQISKQFLHQQINAGGAGQYRETLRQFAPEIQALNNALKASSFGQDDFNSRVAALPPLAQKALRDISTLGKGFEKLGGEAEHGSNGFQAMLLRADLLGRAIAALISVVSNGWQEYLNFGKEIANVNSILGKDDDIGKLRDGILSLKPELGGATELTRGLYQAISSGVDAKDSLDFIAVSARAAKAGVASVYDTVDSGTAIMAAFNLSGKDATKIYDEMFVTVQKGKIEMPQLAQSIGQVASIASLAGISMEEMFAAVATSSLSNKPAQAIEALRTAISNIIKPSDEAKKLAAELGLEFSAAALKSKGLAQFLAEVEQKTGGAADKLNVLFGDVQGFNIIASLGGSRAKVFAENLAAMGNAAGSVDAVFAKQQQSLGAQFENFYNRIGNGLIAIFTAIEPALKVVLGAINYLLPVIIALTVAIGGLRLAWLLMNTGFFTTAAAAIPQVIAALSLMLDAVASVIAGTVTLGVATGGLSLFAAAIGLAVYAWSSYNTVQSKTAQEQQKGIEAVKGQMDALKQQQQQLSNVTTNTNELAIKQESLFI
jgi:TP901 family phage tail tape measure protein